MAHMKDEDLDQVIARAKAGRGSPGSGPDVERVWKRIGAERARQNARRAALRAGLMVAGGAIVLVAGGTAAFHFVPGLRNAVSSYSDGSPVRGAAATRNIDLLPAHQDPKFELRTVVSAGQLSSVDASAILADDAGNIYVSDGKRVAVFDSSGKRVLTLGPGSAAAGQSFSRITAIAWLADTIVVADSGSAGGELTFLSRAGRLLERRALPTGIGSLEGFYAAGEQLFAAGIALSSSGARRTYFRVSPPRQPDVMLGLRDTLVTSSDIVCSDSLGGTHSVRAPFAPQGPMRAFTSGGDLVVAMRDTLEFKVYDSSNGKPAGRIATEFTKAVLPEEKWVAETREVQALREQFGQLTCLPTLTRPATEPVVIAMIADERGRLWVEANGASGRQLLIIDVMQETFEATNMPARDYSVAAGVRGNRMFFVSRDASGRAQISVYTKRY